MDNFWEVRVGFGGAPSGEMRNQATRALSRSHIGDIWKILEAQELRRLAIL